jgi:hypothetical protein
MDELDQLTFTNALEYLNGKLPADTQNDPIMED